ncbi:hypothetical protein BKA83DRAFT_4583538 [Pisolithus microcarpus]|nr:hypothetical protein BKA83DRAFT_4583538 [Pisolithus microcarpus]
MLFKMLGIQRAWQLHSEGFDTSRPDMPRPRQIFVTKSSMLANKVEEYFMKLLESLSLAGCTLEELARLNQDTWTERYSELEDHHFPLFLTFDRLARMIAVDILDADHPRLNFFANSYWPHFPQHLTKGRDPWLVFGEIMGIIKGSEKSLEFDDGTLDKNTYCGLPSRSNPTFSGQREIRQHHDVADRSHAILKTLLGSKSLKGRQVDFLYVDEAQDNLLIDASLLRLLCGNPKGLFWAGDTAQTISAGSSFRFDDLKAFLYRTEPERGIVDGLKPVFFSAWDKPTAHYEQFLFGAPGSHIEFGAQQCILVRNERAKERLREQAGDFGLIMTLYESKGLEFNDVLLYDFFGDSNVDLSRWRVVLAAITGEAGHHNQSRLQRLPSKGMKADMQHIRRRLQAEVLYVGITRARKRLWIIDKSEKAEPMKLFWTSRSQIQIAHLGLMSPILQCHRVLKNGRSLVTRYSNTSGTHKRYIASHANMPREVRIAEAYHLRELARATIGVSPLGEQRRAFAKAADAFVKCSGEALNRERLQYNRTAAECYIPKRYRKAGIFNRTVDVLKSYSKKMSHDCADELLTVCRLTMQQGRRKTAIVTFFSMEEELEFLEAYGLDVALVVLYESHGRYVEAGELHLSEDRPLDAIRVFLRDKTNGHAILYPRARDEIKMFQTAAVEELNRSTSTPSCNNGELRTLPPKVLHLFSLFYTVASHNDPVGGRGIRKLFGIVQLSDDQYVMQPGSFILATPSTASSSDGEQTNPSPYSHGQITHALKERVRLHLRYQVDAETLLCHNAKVFSQCLIYIITGSCNSAKCKQQHVSLSSLDSAQYNARIGIHLQQMRILQLVYSAFPELRECNSTRDDIGGWIAHLYEAFFPPFWAQGSLANLNWSSIQRSQDGIRVMRNWIRDAIYSLEPRHSDDFLTDILRLIRLSSAFGESDALRNANCVRQPCPGVLFRSPGRYIVADMIDSVQSSAESSISAGTLGLRHIIRNNLRVHLSVLCDCIEEVLSAYVLTLRFKNNPGADSLHDVVLPRSWLIRNNKLDARKEVKLIDHLLDDIQYLLEKLRSDSTEDNLWLTHTSVTPVHRNVFIARMMLCLASYNCPPRWAGVKAKISNTLTHLRSNDPTRLTPNIYRKYAEASREGYLRVIVAYDEKHAIPNLLHLLQPSARVTSSFSVSPDRRTRLSSRGTSFCASARNFTPGEAGQLHPSVGNEPTKAHEPPGDVEGPSPTITGELRTLSLQRRKRMQSV